MNHKHSSTASLFIVISAQIVIFSGVTATLVVLVITEVEILTFLTSGISAVFRRENETANVMILK